MRFNLYPTLRLGETRRLVFNLIASFLLSAVS